MAAPRVSATTRVGAAAAALVCLAVLRLLLDDSPAGFVVDATFALASVAATLEAGRRARRGRSRLAWHLQSASAAAWFLAPLAWLTPLPDGLATAGRFMFAVLSGAGWVLASLGSDPWSRVRLVIDSWLVAASVFIVAWVPVFAIVEARNAAGVAADAAIALPLAAVAAAVVCTGVAATEIPPGRRAMPALYVVGLLVLAASDVVHELGGRPFWAVGLAFFVLGTRVYRGTSTRLDVLSVHGWLVNGPYFVLAPAAIILVTHQVTGAPESAETTAAVVMATLLLLRQQVTITENAGLVQSLAATQRQLRHQATHDALTGLPGRVLLHERLDAAIARQRSDAIGLAVIFIDLDDFKVVNDTLGHAAGDDVLVQTAQRLTAVLAPLADDAAAFRMSGDEFAILLTGTAADDATGTAERALESIRQPLDVSTRTVTVGSSIGVAVATGDHVDASAILRAADLAMYEVKHHGKSGVALAPVSALGAQ